MDRNYIELIDLLSKEEYNSIDNFCTSHQGEDSLPAIAQFLHDTFSLDLVLDFSIIEGYATDSSNVPGTAKALCRPTSERECTILMRMCYSSNIPLTISAGKSNLTGSATPKSGIILSVVKMTTPSIAIQNRRATVNSPVGIILEELRHEVVRLSEQKLEFPVNPTSRAEAMLGGALACNASGFTPGITGSIRHWVKAIDFIFPNGKKIRAKKGQYISENGEFILQDHSKTTVFPIPQYPRPPIKNASGPLSSPEGTVDFVEFMVGSEGIFGLITASELSLQKRPDEYLELFFSLPHEKNALDLLVFLSHTYNGDLSVFSALEYFGLHFRKYMKYEEKFFHKNHEVGIYIQLPLFGQNLENSAEAWLTKLTECGCGVEEESILLFDTEREKKLFTEARHSVPSKVVDIAQSRGTYTIVTDTVVPLKSFPEFLASTHSCITEAGIDYVSFGHFGDCHLHFCLLPQKKQLEKALDIYDIIVAKSAELGGTYSGEHGTGKRKHKDFIRCYGQSAVEQVKQAKRAVDPNFVLNRGNVIDIDLDHRFII